VSGTLAPPLTAPPPIQNPIDKLFIRFAKYEELPSIVDLRVDVFYPEFKGLASFHTKILDKLKQRRNEGAVCLLATAPPSPGDDVYSGVACDLPNIIGTVEFSSKDFRGTAMESIGSKKKLYIMDLAVRVDVRRCGLATLLLEEIEKYCKENDYREIYLHVEVDNISARLMYEKNGFVEIPPVDWNIKFTERKLHKSWENYVLLYRSVQPQKR
jgi:ribosomal protein S18 acetylase RimI-like enzyme